MNDYFEKQKVLIIGGMPIRSFLNNIDLAILYKKNSGFMKQIKKLHYHVAAKYQDFWYGEWKNNIKNYDVVILMDDVWGAELIEYIHRKNPRARIIIYYLNKIEPGYKNDPLRLKNLPCEFWSFDKDDCKSRNMHFSHLFYDSFLPDRNNEILYDTFFVGVDKGRLDILLDLKKILEEQNFNNKFIIIKDKHKRYSIQENQQLTSVNITYENVIDYIHKCKCIIDIPAGNQIGLTWRPLEALVYDKKLITSNKDIKTYDFYCSDNIFILGVDKNDRLKSFMERPYKILPEIIKWQYTPEAWIKRFFKKDGDNEFQ